MEKTSITPTASVSAATGSLLDVLRGSSAVTIDGSGQVSLRGNSNVLILVDGVPTTLEGLNGIPAANVQNIDIVTSPDAKYDAEGTGGIISITSKQQAADAFTAMASANYGFNNFMNDNVAMSYNVGRWGVRLNYNGKYEKDHIESELHRQILQTGNVFDQMIDAEKKTTGHNIGMNVNYKVTKKDVVTLDVKTGFPSNDLRHREYIPAAYAMYSSKWNKLTYKAGLRFEYSRTLLQNDKDQLDEASNSYFVAPNMVLNYRFSEPWQLSLGLSRRISRPTYPQLNPYINLIDNNTYETGNVRLKPEKSNKLDLGYSYSGKSLKVNGNAYFNYTQDYIGQIAYLDQNILVMTYINNDQYLNCGVEHNLRWNALRWLAVDVGCNIFYTQSRGSNQGVNFRNQGWTSNNSASVNIMPLKGMTIQAQYFVTTPQYFTQFTTKTVHYCNLGIRQQLPKQGLTFSALLTDVFNTCRWDISSDNPVYTLVNNSKNRSRMLWLGISWNFHSYKAVGDQKKQEEDRSVIRLGE